MDLRARVVLIQHGVFFYPLTRLHGARWVPQSIPLHWLLFSAENTLSDRKFIFILNFINSDELYTLKVIISDDLSLRFNSIVVAL